MRCTKCNAEIPDGAKFCTSCGEPVQASGEAAQEVSGKTAEEAGGAAQAEAGEAAQAEAGEAAQAEAGEVAQAEAGEAAQAESGEAAQAEAGEPTQTAQAEPAVSADKDALAGEPSQEAPQPPVQPQAAPMGAQPTPIKEGKKFNKAVACVIAAVVVIAVAALAALKLTAKDPKEVVITAFENVFPDDAVSPTEELFGASEFTKNMTSANTEAGLTLKLSGSSDEDVNQFVGSGLRMEGQNNRETGESAFNMGVLYNDMDLLNLDAYYGNDKLVMAIPELSAKAFTLNLGEDLAQQIKDSPTVGPLVQQNGIDVDGLAAYINELMEQAKNQEKQPFDVDALLTRYREGCKAQDNFKAALTVTKGDKKNFTMDGKEVSCRGYNTVVSKTSMIEFLNTSSDFFLQDETLRQDFLTQLETTVRMSELMGQTMGGTMTAEQLRDQTYQEVEKSVDEMIAYLDKSLDDINMMVYVDKQGRLAALDGTTVLHPENGTDVNVTFHAELQGGTYLTQNMTGTVVLEDDVDKVSISLVRSGEYDGNRLADDLAVDVDAGTDGTLNFMYTATYTKDDGSYHIGCEVGVDGGKLVTLSANGVVDELEKGKTIHTSLDELRISLEDDADYITLDGEYYLRPLEGTIVAPEGEEMDMLAATEDDWNNVVMEIYGNVFGLLMQMGS